MVMVLVLMMFIVFYIRSEILLKAYPFLKVDLRTRFYRVGTIVSGKGSLNWVMQVNQNLRA